MELADVVRVIKTVEREEKMRLASCSNESF